MTKTSRAHREMAAKLVLPMVPDAWIEDPKDVYGLSTQEVRLLTRAAAVLADFDASLRAELAPRDYRGALGLVRVVRDADSIVHYRALGPRQQLPKGNFLTLYRSCGPLDVEEA